MVGELYDIKRFALHDGPGIRTTVFLKGCPLSCIWCHNPEGMKPGRDIWVKRERCIHCDTCINICRYGAISKNADGDIVIDKEKCTFCDECVHACPSKAIVRIDQTMEDTALVELLLRDKLFFEVSGGGVTFSGGEPLRQPAFVKSVFEQLKANGIDTCIETCMYTGQDVLREIIPYVDHFLVDIKLMDDAKHKQYTGVSNVPILENFRLIAASGKDVLVRIPLIPDITATEENLAAIAAFVRSVNPELSIELINYNSLAGSKYKLMNLPFFNEEARAFPKEQMQHFEDLVERVRRGERA